MLYFKKKLRELGKFFSNWGDGMFLFSLPNHLKPVYTRLNNEDTVEAMLEIAEDYYNMAKYEKAYLAYYIVSSKIRTNDQIISYSLGLANLLRAIGDEESASKYYQIALKRSAEKINLRTS